MNNILQISDKMWKKYCVKNVRGQFLDFESIKELHSESDLTNLDSAKK